MDFTIRVGGMMKKGERGERKKERGRKGREETLKEETARNFPVLVRLAR